VQADDFIDKPFDTQQLRDKVKKLVAQNGSRVAAQAKAAPGVPAAPLRPASIPRTPPPAMPPPPNVAPARPAPPTLGARAAPPPPSTPAPPVHPAHAAYGGAVATNGAALKASLESLDLTAEQVQAVLALSREVVEKVVWEVVPVLAETLIKEEIARLTRE
jgi:hypothetical protein